MNRRTRWIAGAWLVAAVTAACSEAPPASPAAPAADVAPKGSSFDVTSGGEIKVDAAKADASSPDAPTPDSGATDAGSDLAGADGTATDAQLDDGAPDDGADTANQADGEEKETSAADAGKACSADGDCDDGNACTADACTAEGCAWVPKNCDDGLGCTADACDKNSGACKHKALASTCAIDGACFAAGEAAVGNPCKVCNPEVAATAWSDGDAPCDDGNPCTGKDQCAGGVCTGVAKPGCCKVDADCAVSDLCVSATCEASTGSCQSAVKAGCCTEGACCDVAAHSVKTKGAGCGGAVLATEAQCSGQEVQTRTATASCTGAGPAACSEEPGDWQWSAWATVKTCPANATCVASGKASATCEVTAPAGCSTAAQCADADPCTDDACSNGACTHLPKKCTPASTCQTAACEPKTGACKAAVQAGACEIDGVCMIAGVKKATDSCLVCDPAANQKAWSVAAACQCGGGACCAGGVVKPAGVGCGTTTVSTEYGCSADGKAVQSRVAFAGCSGPGAICSTASSYWVWQPWTTVQPCSGTNVCEVADKAKPGSCKAPVDPLCAQPDTYEIGTSFATAYDLGTYTDASTAKVLSPQVHIGSATDVDVLKWAVNDATSAFAPAASLSWSAGQAVSVCLYASCNNGANGKDCQPAACPSAATTVTKSAVSGTAQNGCCLTAAKGTLTWQPKSNNGTNHSSLVYAEIGNASLACTQVAATIAFGVPTAAQCTAGTTCCEPDGTPSPKAKPCGPLTMASEYKCSAATPGASVLVRKAVLGCSGAAATCSSSAADYAWGDWTTYKSCLATEMCTVSATTQPGSCKPATACVAGNQCCTSSGQYASAGTTCGSASATEHQCSADAIQVRKQFLTCAGGGTGCYGAQTWSAWATVQSCQTGQVCTPGALKSTLPTCKAQTPDPCTATDPWEGTELTSASKDLGTFADSMPAIWLDPKVRMQSATDKDYFKFAITDDANLYEPQVYLSWSAPKPVTVCAYYRCSTGVGGQDCAPTQCPFGSEAYVNSFVSLQQPNGCCRTTAVGSLSFTPDAPASTDETGTVFFNVKNADPGCQEVTLKLAFGGSTLSKCDPGSTCCTAKGTWAASTQTCGGAVKTESKCASVGGVPVVQKRTALGTCSGTGASCSTASPVWGAWAYDKACLGPEVCAVGVPSAGGSCIAPKTAGSCAGACGAKSKDGCWCDSACIANGDCCKDFGSLCSGTCDGACGGVGKSGVCWCDASCADKGDCCLDKAFKCP